MLCMTPAVFNAMAAEVMLSFFVMGEIAQIVEWVLSNRKLPSSNFIE